MTRSRPLHYRNNIAHDRVMERYYVRKMIGGRVARVSMPKPPTFDEKKAQYKKAWEATKEIAPDGHYAVQCEIFRMLAHHIEYAIPDFEGDAAIVEGPTPPPA